MEFRTATQTDIDYVRANALDEAVKGYPAMAPVGECITLLHNDVIWGVGGLLVLREGVAEIWLMLTKDFKEHKSSRQALTEIWDHIENHIEDNDIYRTQAVVSTEFTAAIKMIEFFQFNREGTMRSYLPNRKDAYMYARLGA